jgi:hypothetical protein
MIITVVYGKVNNLDAARRCPRCDQGKERYGPRAGRPCPRCDGTGIRPEGWAYMASDALGLAIGDLVECPPTPYSSGQNVQATVVGLTGDPLPGKGLKTIIGRAVVTS